MKKILLLITCLVLLSCGSQRQSSREESSRRPAARNTQTESMNCQGLTARSDLPLEAQWSETHLLRQKLVGDCLCLKHQYSGCRGGEVWLSWPDQWQPEAEPEVMLLLAVSDAGLCEQLLTDSTCFSLKKLQWEGASVRVFINAREHSIHLNLDR